MFIFAILSSRDNEMHKCSLSSFASFCTTSSISHKNEFLQFKMLQADVEISADVADRVKDSCTEQNILGGISFSSNTAKYLSLYTQIHEILLTP